MDGGSADIAGANICPSIPGHKKGRWFSSGLLKFVFIFFYINE